MSWVGLTDEALAIVRARAVAKFAPLDSAQLDATEAAIRQVMNAGSALTRRYGAVLALRSAPGGAGSDESSGGLGRGGVKRVNGPERDVALHVPKVRRPCLRCREPFASTGPGNRRCRWCLLWAADLSPMTPN